MCTFTTKLTTTTLRMKATKLSKDYARFTWIPSKIVPWSHVTCN